MKWREFSLESLIELLYSLTRLCSLTKQVVRVLIPFDTTYLGKLLFLTFVATRAKI